MRFSAEDAAYRQLSSEYAGRWSVWRSDAGRWYATRMTRSLSRIEMDRGLIMTACGESADELRALLMVQEGLAGQPLPSS
ncbi:MULTISPECIES: hypothetical protein [Microbispora]|uniref:Uncharacterized protein n=1 Tax=Microbispora triticiradicis TaxID=2200763 RepID=A0ABX9LF62_9ACTN|nr:MULTISPECIES: hypothetical protein [Microbispora]MBO4275207.1 hypothetical protein [Microbispora triticiradicis]RGA02447.1 hypothetical protein DI270_024310 [Microbispora triticiradicis]GLW24394.1 hypothetical protein Mame01_44370 [Microbispora amethystogenes]